MQQRQECLGPIHTVIGTCVAILLKHRNPKLSLLQKIISLVLYAGHASKQVHKSLQEMILIHNAWLHATGVRTSPEAEPLNVPFTITAFGRQAGYGLRC